MSFPRSPFSSVPEEIELDGCLYVFDVLFHDVIWTVIVILVSKVDHRYCIDFAQVNQRRFSLTSSPLRAWDELLESTSLTVLGIMKLKLN